MTRILPLLISCVLSFVNFGNSAVTVGLNANPTSLTFQPQQRQDFQSQSDHAEITLTGADQVMAWVTIDGVQFQAIEPSKSWGVPFDANTGLMLANPAAATTLHFTISGQTISAPFAANKSTAFFMREAYGRAFSGNLLLTADAPIGVWATECADTCVAALAQRLP